MSEGTRDADDAPPCDSTPLRWFGVAVALFAVALLVAVAISATSAVSEDMGPEPVDRAFTKAMIEHQRLVDAEALVPLERSRRGELRRLARELRMT